MAEPLTAHLVHALALHRKWCRQVGVPFPALLDAMLTELAASRGQSGSTLGDLVPSADPLLVDYETVAERLAVSERTVRRLVASKELPVVRIGGRSLIRTTDLECFVDNLGGVA